MRTKIKYKLMAMALVTAFATPAFAADPAQGPYVGVSGGESDADDLCDELTDALFSGSCDDTDTAWKVFAGYQLDRNWGVEAYYIDFGTFDASGSVLGVPASGEGELYGVGASILVSLPIDDKFSVFGKLGFIYYDLDIDGTNFSIDDGGEGYMYGFGARFSFNERVAIQVEWERFPDIGDDISELGGESDVQFLSAGIVLSF